MMWSYRRFYYRGGKGQGVEATHMEVLAEVQKVIVGEVVVLDEVVVVVKEAESPSGPVCT